MVEDCEFIAVFAAICMVSCFKCLVLCCGSRELDTERTKKQNKVSAGKSFSFVHPLHSREQERGFLR